MWHVTRDMWHVTRDMWHMTHDTWHIGVPSQGAWRGGPMRGLGSGHVTCGPMRGLEINYAGRGHAYIQTDIATLWLNRPSGPIQWKAALSRTLPTPPLLGSNVLTLQIWWDWHEGTESSWKLNKIICLIFWYVSVPGSKRYFPFSRTFWWFMLTSPNL